MNLEEDLKTKGDGEWKDVVQDGLKHGPSYERYVFDINIIINPLLLEVIHAQVLDVCLRNVGKMGENGLELILKWWCRFTDSNQRQSGLVKQYPCSAVLFALVYLFLARAFVSSWDDAIYRHSGSPRLCETCRAARHCPPARRWCPGSLTGVMLLVAQRPRTPEIA